MPVFLPLSRPDLKLKRYRVYFPDGGPKPWEFSAFDDDEARDIFIRVIPESRRVGATVSEVPGRLNGRRVA